MKFSSSFVFLGNHIKHIYTCFIIYWKPMRILFFLMRYITETCQGKNVILIYLILGCSWMKLEVYLIKININLEKI